MITTYDDVMIKYHLLYRKEIDENILESLLKETKISDIYYKSVKKLTTKMMSKKSYKHWLEKFQLSKQNEENLICKLENVGLLNDLYYAKAYASDKARLSKDGIGKIENDLKEEKNAGNKDKYKYFYGMHTCRGKNSFFAMTMFTLAHGMNIFVLNPIWTQMQNKVHNKSGKNCCHKFNCQYLKYDTPFYCFG